MYKRVLIVLVSVSIFLNASGQLRGEAFVDIVNVTIDTIGKVVNAVDETIEKIDKIKKVDLNKTKVLIKNKIEDGFKNVSSDKNSTKTKKGEK